MPVVEGAPKMVTNVPGPKVAALMEESAKYEAFTRGGGGFPVILERDGRYGQGCRRQPLYRHGRRGGGERRGPRAPQGARGHPAAVRARSCTPPTSPTPSASRSPRGCPEVMPEGLRGNCHTSFFQAGSDAVETAIKFSRKHTGRSQIFAFQGAYHGVWCGTTALTTGYNYRHGWGPLIAGVQHLPYAYCYRCPFDMTYPNCDVQCGKYVDYVLNTPYTAADDVAAVIIEIAAGRGRLRGPAAGVLPDHQGRLREERLPLHGRRGAVRRRPHRQDVVHRALRASSPTCSPGARAWAATSPWPASPTGPTWRRACPEGSQPSTFAGNALACEVCMTNIDLITDPEIDLLGRATAARRGDQGQVHRRHAERASASARCGAAGS